MTNDLNDFKYWAFISYSHRDEAFCSWLHKKLDSYKTPASLVGELANDGIHTVPAKLYPIFRDREELPAGANLTDAITSALQDARYLVVICSPHSAESHWVNEEIKYFISLGREKYILPIILDGEPNSTDPQKPECFPPALRSPKEPLAADARKGKDGRDSALMKLRAGLLGVGLEDLVNRELKRQKKQVMWYALLAVFMLALVVFSWFKQQEADAAKNLAFIAEKNAEHNYGLALAEKADRAFAENKVNEGQIYAAHALARIDGARDKDAEITYLLTLNHRLTQPGIPVTLHSFAVINLFDDNKPLSPNGKIYASRDEKDGSVINLSDTITGKSIVTLGGHTSWITSITFSPDGKTLASGSGSYSYSLPLYRIARSQNGKTLASDSPPILNIQNNYKYDNTVRLWDVATGKSIAILNGHTSSIERVTFSLDGKTLASWSGGITTVRLWDVTNRSAVRPVVFAINGYESLSPNEKIRASTDRENRNVIHLLDTAGGKAIAILSGHDRSVNSIHFSPDGKMLASGSDDKTVRLWDVATGKSIAIFKENTNDVLIVAFSPDGKTLISQDADGNVKQWSLNDLSVRDWAAQAAKDEKSYGLKLEGMKLVPIQPDEK